MKPTIRLSSRAWAIAVLAAAGCRGTAEPAAPAPSTEKTTAPATASVALGRETLDLAHLGISVAEEAPHADRLELSGVLEADPAATAVVTARAEGKIVRLTPNVGDAVPAGAVVAIVESEHLHDAQLNHAMSLKKLAAAEADLARRRKLARLGAYGRPGIEEARKQEGEATLRRDAARAEVRASDAAMAEARSRIAAQSATIEQAVSAEALAKAQLDLAERQVQRSQRLLAAELVSRQEHETVVAQRGKAAAEATHAAAEVRAARARLDELEASATAAKARRENAGTAEATANAQWELARQATDRSDKVFRGGYNENREVSEAESAVAQARLAAEGALDDVKLLGGQPGDNHSVPVVAPFAGRVVSRAATLGQTVAAGETILTVVDTSILFAQIAVFPSELGRVRAGASVDVAVAGRALRGTVERIGDVADPSTKAVNVRVRLANPDGLLRPGLPVVASLSGPSAREVVVPSGAIQRLDGKTVVFVPGESEGAFVARPVGVGATQSGKTRIVSGLAPGEKYVSRNAFLVKAQWLKSESSEE